MQQAGCYKQWWFKSQEVEGSVYTLYTKTENSLTFKLCTFYLLNIFFVIMSPGMHRCVWNSQNVHKFCFAVYSVSAGNIYLCERNYKSLMNLECEMTHTEINLVEENYLTSWIKWNKMDNVTNW